MRVSFDLDETLVCRNASVPHEDGWGSRLARKLFQEPLRLGTRNLFAQLRRDGHEVWIYTTSLRTESHIRTWLWLHGVAIDGVVNYDVHNSTTHRISDAPTPSKFPPSFGIHLHVDDLEGVKLEGERHGFNVLIIRPDDLNWPDKVLEQLRNCC